MNTNDSNMYKVKRYVQFPREMPRELLNNEPDKLYTWDEVQDIVEKHNPDSFTGEGQYAFQFPDANAPTDNGRGYFMTVPDELIKQSVFSVSFQRHSNIILPTAFKANQDVMPTVVEDRR